MRTSSEITANLSAALKANNDKIKAPGPLNRTSTVETDKKV